LALRSAAGWTFHFSPAASTTLQAMIVTPVTLSKRKPVANM
jgi:hypothetical protein